MPSLRKNIDSFSRFILIFSLESPTLHHFEGLQTLKILLGERLNAFCNSVQKVKSKISNHNRRLLERKTRTKQQMKAVIVERKNVVH